MPFRILVIALLVAASVARACSYCSQGNANLQTLRQEARNSKFVVIGTLTNVGAVLNGKMVGPQGKIIGRAGGAAYLSNESIAGFVKKLPTNRSNAYPKADALDDIKRGGFLKSYDCRHTGNRALVPPIGSGVPPCVVQGPWEFNGVTAYYPRLQLAPP